MSQPQAVPEGSPRSRFSAIQSNVRNMLRNPIPSSIYSRPQSMSTRPTSAVPPVPRLPQLAFLSGRQRAVEDEEQRPALQPVDSYDECVNTRRTSTSSDILPDHSQPFGGSTNSRISLWHEQPEPITVAIGRPFTPEHEVDADEEEQTGMGRHPADVPLYVEEDSAAYATRPKKRKRRCKACKRGAWVKQKNKRRAKRDENIWQGSTRAKRVCAVLSGFLLIVLLSIYLSLAFTQPTILSKEAHIVFILLVIADTILFAHCAIRLCMLAAGSRRSHRHRHRRRIASLCGPEGFQPDEPVRVHLAADEEATSDLERDGGHVEGDTEAADDSSPGGTKLKVPPPAYGLWRSSVRLNPNLLHWARVGQPPEAVDSNDASTASAASRTPEMQQREPESQAPRPPSYISDDGVSYVMQAEPRSTVFMPSVRPPSQLHPALRSTDEIRNVRDVRNIRDVRNSDMTGSIPVGLGLDDR